MNLTWVSCFMAAVVTYYLGLFAVSLFHRRPPQPCLDGPLVVVIVPARNEELVIAETISSLLALEYHRYLVMVVNDNSTDATGPIVAAAAAASHGRVIAVERSETAGGGKSETLNFGFALLLSMLDRHDPRLDGAGPGDIVVGVVDADGRLDPQTLACVVPLFLDPRVGAAQTGVRIANFADGVLTRLQDMEFVGFSCMVQLARDRFGSVGLGGNGQFARLSALLDLGHAPWTPGALSEDLDLGLSLVQAGWRVRFCQRAYVAQQGLTTWRTLLRQRTRWIQGHYQCWTHLPALLTTRRVRMATRIDLALYLLLVTTVMVASFSLTAGVASALGAFSVTNQLLTDLPAGLASRLIVLVVSAGPLLMLIFSYQRNAAEPLHLWEIPAYALAFTVYSYLWVSATIGAWARIVLRRGSWAKTPRVRTTLDRPRTPVARAEVT